MNKKSLTFHFFVVDDDPSEEVKNLFDRPAQLFFFTAVNGLT